MTGKNIHLKIPYQKPDRYSPSSLPIIDLEIKTTGRKFYKISFLLDTGTDISMIPYELILRLFGNLLDNEKDIFYVDVKGHQSQFKSTELACRLAGVEFPLKVIFPVKRGYFFGCCLLGRNFLNYFNVLLKKEELEIGAKIKEIIFKESRFYKFEDVTAEQVKNYFNTIILNFKDKVDNSIIAPAIKSSQVIIKTGDIDIAFREVVEQIQKSNAPDQGNLLELTSQLKEELAKNKNPQRIKNLLAKIGQISRWLHDKIIKHPVIAQMLAQVLLKELSL